MNDLTSNMRGIIMYCGAVASAEAYYVVAGFSEGKEEGQNRALSEVSFLKPSNLLETRHPSKTAMIEGSRALRDEGS